ncbi:TolC family protein [Tepidibacter thalassicus]|uniref:Outer membrane protein TolC n=1 Tax=Tepidibacter thalassicus DSM 15285 TaxID=1123350 RepID=A0A1M5RA92_9FIRM|nr:TolC family protein [Tepidibacter thalassicus]SHH22733.1 Outer membrane protein TolC [Tepidibacter thalassicus DSM 15285]
MRKVVISILLVFVTLLTSILTYADNSGKENIKKLSLDQAINEAIKNSTDIKVSELDIEIKEIELDKAKYSEKKYDDLKDRGFSLGTVEGFQLDSNMMSKAAEYALEEEKIKKNYKIEDLKYKVTASYYAALQARDYLKVAKDNLENVKRNRDEVKKKLDLGVASKSDLIMADISLNEATVKVEKAKTDLENAYRRLNMVLNYPLDTKLELTSNFYEQKFDVNLNKDLEKAYEQRFDMIQMNHNHEIVKLDFETNSIKYTENTYVYKTKQRNLAKIESLLNDLKKSVEFDIKSKYDAVINAKKQIELAKANVEKAKEGLRLRELSYNAGVGTLLEVEQSANQLYSANVALASAISNYNLAVLDYNKAVNIGRVN